MHKKKPENKFNNISFLKAFAYVSSTGVMIVMFVFIGYMIGSRWGSRGAGIGVAAGGLLGLFTIFSELYRFVRSEKSSPKDPKKNADNEDNEYEEDSR